MITYDIDKLNDIISRANDDCYLKNDKSINLDDIFDDIKDCFNGYGHLSDNEYDYINESMVTLLSNCFRPTQRQKQLNVVAYIQIFSNIINIFNQDIKVLRVGEVFYTSPKLFNTGKLIGKYHSENVEFNLYGEVFGQVDDLNVLSKAIYSKLRCKTPNIFCKIDIRKNDNYRRHTIFDEIEKILNSDNIFDEDNAIITDKSITLPLTYDDSKLEISLLFKKLDKDEIAKKEANRKEQTDNMWNGLSEKLKEEGLID